jgi:hypothetical protein
MTECCWNATRPNKVQAGYGSSTPGTFSIRLSEQSAAGVPTLTAFRHAGPSLREKPLVECRIDLELVNSFLDGRLRIRRLDVAQQRGWCAFEAVDGP